MNRETYWSKLTEVNLAFKKDKVTISTNKLKAIVFQAFEKGVNSVNQKSKPPPRPFKTGCKGFDDLFSNFN